MIKMRRGKSHQVMNEGQVRGYLCKSAFIALFSPHFPLDLGGLKKWVREGKLSPLCSISPIFFPQPNSGKQHFPTYFPFSIFHPPCFHPNQTHLKF